VVPVSSTRAAEMAEAAREHFSLREHRARQRTQTASLRMNIDIWEVIDAAATKASVSSRFTRARAWEATASGGPVLSFVKAREYDFATRFIELAGDVNAAMPHHVVDAGCQIAERS